METPEGFEGWSEECKTRFRQLKLEFDDRTAAEDEVDAARRAARSAQRTLDDLQAAQGNDEAELGDVEQWIDGAGAARRALQQRLTQELNAEYAAWDNPQRRPAERQAKRRELQRKFDDDVQAFDDERDAKRARRRELKNAIRRRTREIADATAANAAARERLAQAEQRLGGFRSFEEIAEDYYRLIRRCGPQDPKPGDPAIPITPRLAKRDAAKPRGRGKRAVRESASFLPIWNEVRPSPAAFEPLMVGAYSDVVYPEEKFRPLPQASRPEHPEQTSIPVSHHARVWHEGCVEFLWVEGTRPYLSDETISNPITRSLQHAAAHVNDIWRHCCVRFRFSLKIVRLADLGPLAGAADGVSVVDGAVTSASKETINRQYAEAIRGLLDHEECTALLVVDRVTDGAGFARFGGKVGIVTVSENAIQRAGTTAAHELGHAVGGIDHVEGEGADRSEHAHGDLMWGEGCRDYPNHQERHYERVTPGDCAKMHAGTTATEEPCDQNEPV